MKLSPEEIAASLAQCPGWTLEDPAIRKTYRLDSFADAIAFVTRLAFAAEAADHHPDLHVSYRNVTVAWSTHSAGGLTARDFDGARQSDMIAARLLPR
jgi:4a-hydroxytetrahydrobiopterin dehydratase